MTTGKNLPAKGDRRAELRGDAGGDPTPHYPPDFLRFGSWLLVAITAILTACILTVVLDEVRTFTPKPDPAGMFYRAIGLSEPALIPAGRHERQPHFLPTAVDGRYLPLLPRETPGGLPLLDAGQLSSPRETP